MRLDLRSLWRNSPVAVMGVALIGVSNSAFGTLAAVYADRIGLVLTTVALFTSLPILAGAAAQIPVGYLSDRIDRRKVLVGIAVVAALDSNARDYNAGFTHYGRLSHESYAYQRALEKAHDYLTFAIASAMPRPPLSKLGSLWALGIAVSLGVAEHVLTKLLRALRLVN